MRALKQIWTIELKFEEVYKTKMMFENSVGNSALWIGNMVMRKP